ncbi:MAG: phosphoglycerate kinase [Microgenomates group bacterium]
MNLRTVTAKDIEKKRVLMRVDYNVPLEHKNGAVKIVDGRRIKLSLETLHFLLKHNAKVTLISHLGRPKGEPNPDLTLKPIANYLQKECDISFKLIEDWIENLALTTLSQAEDTVHLLENLRFYPGEKKNDPDFSKKLAEPFDVYINDAFSAAHRAHASTVGVTKFLPSFAGFALTAEVSALSKLLENPVRPLAIVIGGAKISDKVAAAKNLTKIADFVLIGGAVANNFLKADGIEIHKSFIEEVTGDLAKQGIDYVKFAEKLMEDYKTERILKDGYIPLPKILYPVDVLAARSLKTESKNQVSVVDLSHDMADTPDDKNLQYLDIGPKTIRLYSELLKHAKTVFWNGPMGVWENKLFRRGTKIVAQTIANSKATTVLGGGDTIAAVDHFGLEHDFSYISAAGGASLDFLGGAELPGLKPLQK